MTDELFNTLPQEFIKQLQNACTATLDRYVRFLENDPGDDPKRVTAHHNAGKAAVTHMTALVKLLQIFTKIQPIKNKETDMESLLRQARQVLAAGPYDAENQL